MRIALIYLIGVVFGVGISVSGMANPAKVLNFFDLARIGTGTWDGSLLLVMVSALVTAFVGYRLVLGRASPLMASSFALPTRRDIDMPLIAGSATFGIGWGIAGFCPGGALPALGTGAGSVFLFTAALIGGIVLAKLFQTRRAARMAAAI